MTAVTGVVLAPIDPSRSPPGKREMMAWAAEETPADSTFAVIGYPVDRGFVEWFPALSGRENRDDLAGQRVGPRRDPSTGASRAGPRTARRSPAFPRWDYYVVRQGCCTEGACGTGCGAFL